MIKGPRVNIADISSRAEVPAWNPLTLYRCMGHVYGMDVGWKRSENPHVRPVLRSESYDRWSKFPRGVVDTLAVLDCGANS